MGDGTEQKAAGRISAQSAGGTLDLATPLYFDPLQIKEGIQWLIA